MLSSFSIVGYRFTFLNRRAHELLSSEEDDILARVLFEKFPGATYEGARYVAAYTGSMERGEVGDFEAYYPEPFKFLAGCAWLSDRRWHPRVRS